MGPHSLLLAATVIFQAFHWSHQYDCDVATICSKHHDPGDKVQDPFNCHNYYICTADSGVSDVLTCPEEEYFENGGCRTETTPCITQCAHYCPTHCTEDFGLVPDPFDCTLYNACLNGSTIEDTCAPDSFFNGVNCQPNPTFCCDPCIPFCNYGDLYSMVEDPLDCKSYYLCGQESAIPVDKGTCNEGYFFDYKTRDCVEGDDCSPVCPSGTTSTTAPTTVVATTETTKVTTTRPTTTFETTSTPLIPTTTTDPFYDP